MVKNCANPACAAPFLYWRGGKLFRFDVKAPCEPYVDVPEHSREPKPSSSSVFFWLCEDCCSTMVLSFDQHQGLAVLPLNGGQRDGSVTGLTGAQELRAPSLVSRGQAGSIGRACDPIEGER